MIGLRLWTVAVKAFVCQVAYLTSFLVVALPGMVKEIHGSYKIKYHPNGKEGKDGQLAEEIEIDFTPPFRRIPMIAGLEELSGLTIPKDLTAPGQDHAQEADRGGTT